MSPVSVLVVDDDELTRTGLRALLSTEDDLTVVGEAADGSQVLPMVVELRPDIVLMDVRMPGMDGITATRLLRRELPEPPKVVVITTFENDEYVYDALHAGASGFLLKRARSAQIAHALRLIATGESVLFPDTIRRLAAARPGRPPNGSPGSAPLTGRELDVLRLMASGLSNLDIAGRLYVSLETVKTHVGNILAKLGADNRTQAVVMAYESGFVTPGG
ncbi:response regulator [Phytomonospora endophytica]|uniref:DNA-binding NarL/FixJ family response regulator n=1 Tax=Phytomonospora endophytica TaxID=714109 RepID=A0A841FTD5_9ACTN|nr:response regulator transcription factor [Phytomonospora endophytica]MBB6039296.1 DNA-binding NarL/FixJ family response regulator [Phytomonospora endophytica]GIG69762.1 DNA-binding response regulator [Phytomonospora endophytica]